MMRMAMSREVGAVSWSSTLCPDKCNACMRSTTLSQDMLCNSLGVIFRSSRKNCFILRIFHKSYTKKTNKQWLKYKEKTTNMETTTKPPRPCTFARGSSTTNERLLQFSLLSQCVFSEVQS